MTSDPRAVVRRELEVSIPLSRLRYLLLPWIQAEARRCGLGALPLPHELDVKWSRNDAARLIVTWRET